MMKGSTVVSKWVFMLIVQSYGPFAGVANQRNASQKYWETTSEVEVLEKLMLLLPLPTPPPLLVLLLLLLLVPPPEGS